MKVITGTNPEDEASLVQRTFTQDRRHLPITETTGNGSTVSFAYDDFGRITSRTVDSDPDKVVSYHYGKDGRLEKTANTETGTTERIRYDLVGREMSRETKDQNGNTVHAAYAAYDESQNVSMHVEKLKSANGTLKSYKTRYVYDRDDRTAATLFGEDADTTRTTLIYDGLGRVTNRKTYNGSSCTITESYTYAPGYTGYSANAATDLITGMSQTGMVQSYAYDDNGRISSWVCNNKKCSYEYDAIGQLIRVNDEKDTRGHSTGTTWTYEYDNGGNILARKRYAYTEGKLPTNPDSTDTWTYDAGWKDKLYTFNNSQIVSDAIGNILSDSTWTYTWEGRKLVGMSNNSKTITFLYDENGQRIRKAVTENGNTVTTEYVVSGKSVTHVIKGTEDLHIFYANGQPSHCKYGSSMYTYVCSLQGDVLGLKDNTGALVVTYLYDAWGKEISRGGTLEVSKR